MLVLSRKIGERIVLRRRKTDWQSILPYELAITIVAVEGNRVRLGISAPAEVAVYREEIWNQICQQVHSSPAQG